MAWESWEAVDRHIEEALGFGYNPVANDDFGSFEDVKPVEIGKPSIKDEVNRLVYGGLSQQAHEAHEPAA